jgi:GT2 family glycosyltransferase
VLNEVADVWIVLVNYNGLADTRRCLASLCRQDYPRRSVLVVDNASTEDPRPSLAADFPDCHLLRSSTNTGWAGGNNLGIRYALEHGADQVILLNNDTVAAPDLVSRLVSAAAAHPAYGVLGPVIRFLEPPHDVMTDGCTFNGAGQTGFFQRLEVTLTAQNPPAVAEVDIVNGCCTMVAAPVFNRIGLIDERFFLVHEEADFCLRARRAGYRCGVIDAALVWHKGSSSFKRTGKAFQRYYDARNLMLLLHKHPPRRAGQRSLFRSRWEYVKYLYHRFTLEKENGQEGAADAVLEGFLDGLAGRYGIRRSRHQGALPVLRALAELGQRWRARFPRPKEGESRATALC